LIIANIIYANVNIIISVYAINYWSAVWCLYII